MFVKKWNLRSMLMVLTLIGVVMGWKYNHRNRILDATKRIQNLGGQVIYRRENPVVKPETEIFRSPFRKKPHTKIATLPDGTKEAYEVYSKWSSDTSFVWQINSLVLTGPGDQEEGILGFLGNSDILVDAVSVRESDVDSDFVEQLRKLNDLKIIMICRDRKYFGVLGTNPNGIVPTDIQLRSDRLKELEKPYEDGKSLIHNCLPSVKIIDGVWK